MVVLLKMKKHWIAIDWGTTNFRAFLLCGNERLAQVDKASGLLSVEKPQFAATLHTLLEPWLRQYGRVPIVMAGMVGSPQGWQGVPYAPQPCGAQDLVSGARMLTTPWGSQAWIVPGVQGASRYQQPDVMRGEEVQLVGLSALHPAKKHQVLLPGTHSKHVHMADGKIVGFSTFMTGELFSLLSQHSLLGRELPAQSENDAAFVFGVSVAQQKVPFSHLMFSTRTRRLTGEIPETHVLSYLSGLLIGYELSTLTGCKSAWIVGSPALTDRYQRAAEQMALELHPANGDDCFVRGMTYLFALLEEPSR